MNKRPQYLENKCYLSGDGLKRREVSQTGVVTTFVWDGSEYLGEV